MPLLALLDQFAPDFPRFCKVGMGHNQKIDFEARGFVAVARSVHLLQRLEFEAIFVDEAHHPLPSEMPKTKELYRFSATHTHEPDFRYDMGQAIDDGVLCDYDITVPAVTERHTYVCLADLLLKQVGRFRRVLAYCNTVGEAKKFRMVLEELGMAAWHINSRTSRSRRMATIDQFSGNLTKCIHVLVTVEVLGEGVNIPNADTCMFVEPRNSYRSIIQAVGRVLRHHPCKTQANIVLPALSVRKSVKSRGSFWHAQGLQERRSPLEGGKISAALPQHAVEESEIVWQGSMTDNGAQMAETGRGTRGQTDAAESRLASSHSSRGRDLHSDERLRGSYAGRAGRRQRQIEGILEEEHEQEQGAAGAASSGRKASETKTDLLHTSSSSSSVMQRNSSSKEKRPRAATKQPRRSLQRVHPTAAAGNERGGVAPSPVANLPLPCEEDVERFFPGPTHTAGMAKVAAPGSNWNGFPLADVATARDIPLQHSTSHRASAGISASGGGQKGIGRLDSDGRGYADDYNQQQAIRSGGGESWRRAIQVQPKRVKLVSQSDEFYSSQAERFLSVLVQADSRWVDSSMRYRVHFVDCRLGAKEEHELLRETVYEQLSSVLKAERPLGGAITTSGRIC